MLGADHHGYIGRMRAMSACFGDDPERNLEILIGQLVNLVSDGEPVRMSKRAGTVITLEDLVDAIGVDAARYALARYSADSPIDIDIELWTRATNDNPVYYVQYVARPDRASWPATPPRSGSARATARSDPSCSTTRRRTTLLKALGEFPRVVADGRRAARAAPGRPLPGGAGRLLPPVLRQLPGAAAGRRGDHRPATAARLWLDDATRTVIANGLGLLGVSAPERM